MCHDADVAQILFSHALEQGADAGLVYFAAQKVSFRHQRCNVRCGLPHAKADLQDHRLMLAIGLAFNRFQLGKRN